jgi:CheY-like chemotaxis protein
LRSWHLRPLEFAAAEEALSAARLAARHRVDYPLLIADASYRTLASTGTDPRDGLPDLEVILLGSSEADAKGDWVVLRTPIRHTELRGLLESRIGTRLPRIRDVRPAAQHAAAMGKFRPSILVAEDNPLNQKLAQRVLESVGYLVTLVSDGREAVRAATSQRFDVILMDVQMPEMDGESATRALRKEEEGSAVHTPIIALTAHALAGERERLLALGMDDYLSKPYDPSELLQKVARLCANGVPLLRGSGAQGAEK